MSGGVIVPWLAEIIIITVRDVKKGATNNVAGLPLPADYLASFAIFGVLGALPDSASTFAAVTGWGFVIASFLNLFDPTFSGQNGNGTATTTSTTTTTAATSSAGTPAPASIPTQANLA